MPKLHFLCSILLPLSLIADEITTFFGTFDVQDPVILELIQTDAMQRLKRVEQYGVGAFVTDAYSFTRYDHSLGVFLLCRKFGATLQEQVAALLHDVSHTAFSHTGDIVFDHEGEDAYQDAIHEWYIKQTDLYPVLQQYGMEDVVTDESKDQFTILEQDLPDLCADRLEYNLDVGLREQLITCEEALYILLHIKYVDGRWYFDDQSAARQFGLLTISLTRNLWGSVWNGFVNSHAGQMLKYALDKEILTVDDMHFGFDDEIWQRLHAVNDAVLNAYLKQLKEYDQAYRLATDASYDYYYKPKCRAVDPWVISEGTFTRLSEIDDLYNRAYQDLKDYCKDGWCLKVL
jgi:hypothetical protein